MKKLLLLATILFITNAHAQWVNDAMINTPLTSSGTINDPIAHRTANGDIMISTRPIIGSGYGVGAQKVDAQGYTQFGPNGVVMNSSDTASTFTTIYNSAIDANGSMIVAYQDNRTGGADIFASKIDASGNNSWGAGGIQLSTFGDDYNPQVIVMDDFSAIICWQTGDSSGLRFQRLAPDGTKMWGTDGVFYHYAPGAALKFYNWPILVKADSSSFFVAFRKANASFNASQQNLCLMKFDLNGTPLYPNDITFQNIGQLPIILRLNGIPDGQGGLYLAWMDGRNSGLYLDPAVQHIDASGAEVFPANGVNPTGFSGSIEANGIIPLIFNNTFCAAYYNSTNIFFQAFDAAGNLQLPPLGVVVATTTQSFSQLNAVSTSGGILITYSEDQNVLNRFYANKVDLTGVSMWGLPLSVATSASSKSNSTLTTDYNNNCVLVWQDNRSGNDQIYGQAINLNGTLSTGINDADALSFTVYPNPATDKIFINENIKMPLVITDINGKLMSISKVGNYIDVSVYSDGVYFIKSADGKIARFVK